MQTQLEEEVSKTAAVVSDWRRSIASIETQVNAANLALIRAKKAREIHALKASLGDAAAIAAIKTARIDQLEAEQRVADFSIALPAAQQQLVAAEKAAAEARRALARFNAEVLMRKRIDVAAQLDKVIVELARLYGEYESLGREIINMDTMPRTMHGTSNYEEALGARRVRASLPRLFWRLFPGAIHDEMKTECLATAEARFWSLPPEQSEKAA